MEELSKGNGRREGKDVEKEVSLEEWRMAA